MSIIKHYIMIRDQKNNLLLDVTKRVYELLHITSLVLFQDQFRAQYQTWQP